jgi:potassium/hydrogen antiporter
VTVEQLGKVLLLGSAVLLLAVAAARLSARTGLPSMLLYFGLGLFLGRSGGFVHFTDPELARVLGYGALAVILAEGGLTTPWPTMRPVVAPAAVLATVGTAVSVLVTGAAAHLILGLSWRTALLLGAIVSSTDAAAVFSVLRRVPLPPRLSGLLEAESGANDAPVVILVVALSSHGSVSLPALVGLLVFELGVGAVAGLVVGQAGALLLRRVALPASGLYPLAVLAYVFLAYGLADVLHGSGFLATYVSALILGNARLPHRPPTRAFVEGMGWLAQIGLFIMLGLLTVPSRLPDALLPALGVGAVLLLVARPLSVLASVSPFRVPWREQAFLSWAGLRGAVPIVMATVPVVEGVRGSDRLFDVVVVLVIVLTLLQAPTLPWVARRLGVAAPAEPHSLDVEALPLEEVGADLLQLQIPDGSQMHGVEIFELRLPRGSAVTLVVRDGSAFVPAPSTTLRHGDELLVVTTDAARDAAERRLRAVHRGGRLAGWLGDEHGRR